MGKGPRKNRVIILATAGFMTFLIRTLSRDSLFPGMRFLSRRGIAVLPAAFVALFWAFPCMALMPSVPATRAEYPLACKLQDVPGAGASGQPGKDEGAEGCRLFRIRLRFDSGTGVSASGQPDNASGVRTIGNALEVKQYHVDVCENTTGLILVDEHHPFVKRMIVQGGRSAGYGQDIDYLAIRHGFFALPRRVGQNIRVVLTPWAGSLSGGAGGGLLQPPAVENRALETVVDVAPGQWVDIGSVQNVVTATGQERAARVLGNAGRVWKAWIRVEEARSLP